MKRILVVGALGSQGGSVVDHLLKRGNFIVRAMTRKPHCDEALELVARGAEVVRGDLGDRASIRASLRGVDAVFGVTNYWEHFEKEAEHGRNLVNAVAGAEVEHLVLSTLPSVQTFTNGELKCPHFDQKFEMELYASTLGIPSTFVHVACYYDNFPKLLPIGFNQGEVSLAGVASEDIGGVVATIFERPDDFIGRTVGIVGDDMPPAAYASAVSRATGKKVRYHYIPREVFAALPIKGAAVLADMFEFNRRFYPTRRRDLEQSRTLYPAMQTFEQWVAKNAERL